MITKQELENLGFTANLNKKSPYTGLLTDFHKIVDNGHIIEGHDITKVFVEIDSNDLTIKLTKQSSWIHTEKETVFKGKCANIEFFSQILESVL